MRRLLLSLAILPALFGLALAQAPVQQSPTRLDSATAVAVTGTAVNNQYTATVTVPAGQYAYITAISFDVCTNGTGTAANQVTFTSTNLSGSPVWPFSVAATASICQHWIDTIPGGLKSSIPGTNVTVVTPAAAANNSYTVRIYYYLAP
jgi:hypothetical protein